MSVGCGAEKGQEQSEEFERLRMEGGGGGGEEGIGGGKRFGLMKRSC